MQLADAGKAKVLELDEKYANFIRRIGVARMIDPTEDEASFILRLDARGGELGLQGSVALLKIDRLIPEYVTHVSASTDTGHFSLTEKGRQLAQLIKRKYPSL
jgi:hypothetical protein